MPVSAEFSEQQPHRPVLVVTDTPDTDPVRPLLTSVPMRRIPPARVTTEAYLRAPLVILDDRSHHAFRLRGLPHRPGLIVTVTDPDDATVYERSAAVGAEAVIRPGDGIHWLHLRIHDATGCRYADWEALLTDRRPLGPPPPAGT